MKTIVGRPILATRSHILECMNDLIPITQNFFSSWHSHDEFGYNGELFVLPNAIYTYPNRNITLNVTRVENFTTSSRVPSIFYDTRENLLESTILVGYQAIRINVNEKRAGYYLTNLNTLVLTDWTHSETGIAIFKELWPEMIQKLGLTPLHDIPTIKIDQITIGADPEFELVDDAGELYTANNFVSCTRDSEIGVDGAGDQVEIRPSPGTPVEVTKNIKKLVSKFSKRYPYFQLSDAGNGFPLGGHIHVGIGHPFDPPSDLVTMLDDFVGRPTLNLSGRARSYYKKLSQVRSQPHGFEYRSPPSAIFQNPAITYIVLKLVKNLCRKFFDCEAMQYHDDPTIEDYVTVGGLTKPQATYFMKFCNSYQAKNSIVASWKIMNKPTVTFRNDWTTEAKKYYRTEFANCQFLVPFNIELYGIGRSNGDRLCTIKTSYTEQYAGKPIWNSKNNKISIGVSWDLRHTVEKAFIKELCEETKNYIKNLTEIK